MAIGYGAGGAGSDPTTPYGTIIPELWSATYLQKWHLETIFDKIVNTDYEGQFQNQGDVIHIRTIPDITINKYYKGTTGLSYQRPNHAVVDMKIDQAQYWALSLNDIDMKQSNIELAETWATEAKTQLHETIETELFEDWYSSAHASNKGNSAGVKSADIELGATGAPRFVTKENVDEFLTDVALVLDEQNVPKGDRALIVPFVIGKLIKVSGMFTADKTGDSKGRLISGVIGEVDGLMIYCSNNVEQVTDATLGIKAYNAFACHKKAISFATQMTKIEDLRSESDFNDLARGLQVYGSKVTKAEGVVHAYIAKG